MSNFLGDVHTPQARSSIISGNELIAREGVNLQKSMNFRDGGPLLSVFLVLPRGEEYRDTWDEERGVYTFEGHDSTTVESGKSQDQIAMYESGKLSDNGKFLKQARAFADGVRREPLQVQIYEKLDPGVWFDKGFFNLIDAAHVQTEHGKVFQFKLEPAGHRNGGGDFDWEERLFSASEKAAAWNTAHGRCGICGSEENLTFVKEGGSVVLRCGAHGGRRPGGLLG